MILTIVSAFFLLLFLFSVAVQYNDPDGPVWMIAYSFPSALCAFALFHHIDPIVVPMAAVYFVFAAIQMPWKELGHFWEYVSSWHMKNNSAEVMREALGLFLCSGYMGYLSLLWYQQR